MMTHSLVTPEFMTERPNEHPPELTHQGQQVFLLRRIVSGSVADLTLTEARALIIENTPEEEL